MKKPSDATTLYVELIAGESLRVGDVNLRLEHKSGQRARLCVQAPAAMRILRPRARKSQEAQHVH